MGVSRSHCLTMMDIVGGVWGALSDNGGHSGGV